MSTDISTRNSFHSVYKFTFIPLIDSWNHGSEGEKIITFKKADSKEKTDLVQKKKKKKKRN